MIVANQVASLNTKKIPQHLVSRYVAAVYLVINWDDETNPFTYYNTTDCKNVIPEDDPRIDYLMGYKCPDVQNLDDFFYIQGSYNYLGI